jgi:hypothetical protein
MMLLGLKSAGRFIGIELLEAAPEHLLRHAFLTLLDRPRGTWTDILRLFDDAEFWQRGWGG